MTSFSPNSCREHKFAVQTARQNNSKSEKVFSSILFEIYLFMILIIIFLVPNFPILGFKQSLENVQKLHNIEERKNLMKRAKEDDIMKRANELKRMIEEYQRRSKKPD